MPLFEALAKLNAEPTDFYRLDIMGRCESNAATSLESMHARGWADFVVMRGQCAYEETLDAMEQADILVLFDSPGRTIGVPAKLYEYLGAGRPILALAEHGGDVATILKRSGVLHRIASPKNALQIQQALRELAQAMRGKETVADASLLQRFTRQNLTGALANHLDTLIGKSRLTSARVKPADVLQEVET